MAQRLYLSARRLFSVVRSPVAAIGEAGSQRRRYGTHQKRGYLHQTGRTPTPTSWLSRMNTSPKVETPPLPSFKSLFNSQVRGLSVIPNRGCSRKNSYPIISTGLYLNSAQTSGGLPLTCGGCVFTPTRGVVIRSKLGKRKSVKSVAKRFIRTGSGKLKYWPAGKTHNMLAKSLKRRKQLRKPRYASKTQLKTLNKMISGW